MDDKTIEVLVEQADGLRIYRTKKEIFKNGGYWIVEARKGHEIPPGLLTFTDAMVRPAILVEAIGGAGLAIISGLDDNRILDYAFAVIVVSSYQINVLLRPGFDAKQLDRMMGASIQCAMGVRVKLVS
jgi:hypothetical protein